MRVAQLGAQHLQAAANAQHAAARACMGGDGRVQPLRAQPGQIAGRGLAAGQHDPVSALQLRGRARPDQAQARHVFQGLEFIQIAQARPGDDGHRQRRHAGVPAAGRRAAVVKHPVFFGQAVLALHGNGGHGGHARQAFELLRRGREQGGIAPEFVEHKAVDERTVGLGQQRPGAVKMGESAAPVHIGHQQAARASVAGHAHVHDIARHEVDLGGRACAFDDQHVVFGPQRIQRGGNVRPGHGPALAPGQRRQLRAGLPQQHGLAARIGLGLEQQRVHAHIRHGARGQRLKVLGRADFAHFRAHLCRACFRIAGCQARHHAGVVAHVLRLERGHFQALVGIVAAQRRGQPAFARAAAGAQHHHAARQPLASAGFIINKRSKFRGHEKSTCAGSTRTSCY